MLQCAALAMGFLTTPRAFPSGSVRAVLPRMSLLLADATGVDQFAAQAGAELADDVGEIVEQAAKVVVPAVDTAMEQASQVADSAGDMLEAAQDSAEDIIEAAQSLADMDADAMIASLGSVAPYAVYAGGALVLLAFLRALPAAFEAAKPALTAGLALAITIFGFGASVQLTETLPFLGDPFSLFAKFAALAVLAGGSVVAYGKLNDAASVASAKIDEATAKVKEALPDLPDLPELPTMPDLPVMPELPKPAAMAEPEPEPEPTFNPFGAADFEEEVEEEEEVAAAPKAGPLSDFEARIDARVAEIKAREQAKKESQE